MPFTKKVLARRGDRRRKVEVVVDEVLARQELLEAFLRQHWARRLGSGSFGLKAAVSEKNVSESLKISTECSHKRQRLVCSAFRRSVRGATAVVHCEVGLNRQLNWC